MFYSHGNVKYHVADPIPLSDRSVPIVELKTVETSYKGYPFTRCIEKSNDKATNKNYEISICHTARKVDSIIKRTCF